MITETYDLEDEAQLPRPVSRASRNAWKHGLTVPPSKVDEEVIEVCHILADEVGLEAGLGTKTHAVVELARSMVQLSRVDRKIREADQQLAEIIPRSDLGASPRERGYNEYLARNGIEPERIRDPEDLIHLIAELTGDLSLLDPVSEMHRELALLQRYKREAESWRRKSLKNYHRVMRAS